MNIDCKEMHRIPQTGSIAEFRDTVVRKATLFLSSLAYFFLKRIPRFFRPGSCLLERRISLPIDLTRLPVRSLKRTLLFPAGRVSITMEAHEGIGPSVILDFQAVWRTPLTFLAESLMKRHADRIIRETERMTNEVYLDALRKARFGDARFPALENANFVEPPPTLRELFDRTSAALRAITAQAPVSPPTSEAIFRRLLLVPLGIEPEALKKILPPPFLCIPGTGERPLLYFMVWLDGGTPDDELASGEEMHLRFALHARVTPALEGETGVGWLPLFASRVPLYRPRMPLDPYTAEYRFLKEGIRFTLANRRREALFQSRHVPWRVLQGGDGLPEPLTAERIIYRLDGDGNVRLAREQLDYAVNRIYVTTATRVMPELQPTAFFSKLLGVPLTANRRAFFLGRLAVAARFDTIPLRAANYRLYGEATTGRKTNER